MSNDLLKVLAGLESYGYRELDVEIQDVKLKLGPLKTQEMIAIFERVGSSYIDEIAAELRIKVEIIAASIVEINGKRIDTRNELMYDSINIVSNFGEELINFLFMKYCELDTAVQSLFDKPKDETPEVEGA